MEIVRITFEDVGIDKYIQNTSSKVLGRMYDNNATKITITRPSNEIGSSCYMIVTDNNGKVLDQIDMASNETYIRGNISSNYVVNIGFTFTRIDGYVKNSSVEKYYFEKSINPNTPVDVPAEQAIKINQVINSAFTSVKFEANDLNFYNINDENVGSVEIDISSGISNKEFVDELPTENIDPNTLYFLRKVDAEENDYFDEYIYKDGVWEKIGSTKIPESSGSGGVNPSLRKSYIEVDTSLKTISPNTYNIPIKAATGDFEVYDELGNVDKYETGATAITHDYGEGNTYAGKLTIVGNGFDQIQVSGYNESNEEGFEIKSLILDTINVNGYIARKCPNLEYVEFTNKNMLFQTGWGNNIAENPKLKTVIFPDILLQTQSGTFRCLTNTALENVTLPKGNYGITIYFYGKTLKYPEGFTGTIGTNSLLAELVEYIEYPSTLEKLIIPNKNNTVLKSITLKANRVVTVSGVSNLPTNLQAIYVPANLVAEYKVATNWVSIADKIFAISPQGKIIKDIVVNNWVEDTSYNGYGYKADISIANVTSNTYAEVVFSGLDAASGNYLPICETGEGYVSVYSKSNAEIVIPLIKLTEGV